jgi:hypothetical protein
MALKLVARLFNIFQKFVKIKYRPQKFSLLQLERIAAVCNCQHKNVIDFRRNEILLDPSFNVVPYDSDEQFQAVKEILRLRYTKPQPENPDDNEVTSDPPFEIEEEDDYPGPIDQLQDDGPKFQPPFFGHLDDFSSLSALLRFHRQQRRTGRKNLVAQV